MEQSSSDSFPKTLALGRENGGKNACFTPLFDSNNIYFRVGSTPWGIGSGKIYAYYYNSASDQYANWGVLGGDNGCPEYKRDDDKRIHFDITSVNAKKAYSKLIVYRYNNGTTEWQTVDIDVSGTPKNGGGRIYQIRNDQDSGSYTVDFIGYGSSPESSGTWSTSGSYVSWTITGTEGDPTQYYSYQPEDRYGMISNDNSTSDLVTKGTADINDYIYITVPDSITTPYVLFYSDTSGSTYINTTTGTGASAKGLPLNVTADMNMQLNGSSYSVPYTTGTDTKTYKVRLPKNAKSFKVGNGTATGAAFALEGTLSSVYTSNGQLSGGSGDQVNVQNFRHAGSTFSVDSSLAITLSDVRDGYTVSKQAITDPLNPRTDADYVFFTDDASNTMGDGTRKTVYAYFYGDTDGEYSAWPGIKATATNTNVADTTYTDSNGNTVYMFLAPKDTNGKYKYVIFNNGQNDTSRKNTRAIEYSPGRNYPTGYRRFSNSFFNS